MKKIDQYIRKKKLQLGTQVKSLHKIYLDMNYWIRMRECFCDKPKNCEFMTLYELLLELIEKEKIICPISNRIFYELLKQIDPESLYLTVKVISQLSKNVCILSEPEREQLELYYYVRAKVLGENDLYTDSEFIWTKAFFVLGMEIPYIENIPDDIQFEIQSKFLDYLWEYPLEKMLESIQDRPLENGFRRKDTIKTINNEKLLANKELSSLKKLFCDELLGALDIYQDTITDFYDNIYSSNKNLLNHLLNKGLNSPKEMLKLIYDDIKSDRIEKYLPSLYIHICLHTLMRWDKNRLFKANDLDDFWHACSALPYYDLLLTEKPLTQLLNMGPYKLNLRYGKTTLYEPAEAIKYLEQI